MKNIAHRDLKLENIVMEGSDIKIIDFGISKLLQSRSQIMEASVGTPLYVSPEVLDGNYDIRCDLWSLGVIAYMLLSGNPPFNGKNTEDLVKKIKTTDYDFEDEIWDNEISKDAQEFIEKLLHYDPEKRMLIDEALEHNWLKDVNIVE